MIPTQGHSTTLVLQLQQLEDFYAQCLADEVPVKVLGQIWNKIKAIRQQIYIPINSFELFEDGNSYPIKRFK